MNVTATVTGDAEIERRLQAGAIERPIHTFLDLSGLVLVNQLKRNSRIDTGTGRRSMHHVVNHRDVVAGTNLLYMKVMARGRGAGKPWPPKGVLLGWMARKSIPADKEFAIRRAIGRKGIKGDDFDVKAAKAAIPEIQGLLPAFARDLVAEIAGG